MRQGSFSRRLFTASGLIILALTISILVLSTKVIRSYYHNDLISQLKNQALLLEMQLQYQDRTSLQSTVSNAAVRTSNRITIIDPEGVVLADSEKNPVEMENHKDRPEIIKAYQGETGHSLRFSDTLKSSMLYVAVPHFKNGQMMTVIRFSRFANDIDNLLRRLNFDFIKISLIFISISLLLAFLLAIRLNRPLNKLISASNRIANGDFTSQIDVSGGMEFTVLSRSFNTMTDKVNELFQTIKAEKEELDSILSEMQEGLLIIDESGMIKMANKRITWLVGRDSIKDHYYWEVFRDHHINDYLKRITSREKVKYRELELGGRSLLTSVSYLPLKKAHVVIFYDITEAKELEDRKKDFVANASHELRTPLTMIRGFIENLLGERQDEKTKKFLTIIDRNTRRMNNIIEDLLTLARIDSSLSELDRETINLNDLIKNIHLLYKEAAAEKGLEIRLDIPDDLLKIEGDLSMLEQVFTNLISNAVKYTEKGSISISAENTDKAIIIRITDTGIGIPAYDQDKIFERFYVVDKSRSREKGGTGLGLAIVKTIISVHQGSISVESTPGKGSVFTIILPVKQTDSHFIDSDQAIKGLEE